MEKLIKKYIDRIKIDYPEDDKLMIDLQDFYKEAQSQAFILADVSDQVCRFGCQLVQGVWYAENGHRCAMQGGQTCH